MLVPSSRLNVPGNYSIDLAGLIEPRAYDIHARERGSTYQTCGDRWVLRLMHLAIYPTESP
jgi:hypothetical protein